MTPLPREISVADFAAWRADPTRPPPVLLDVRNEDEFDFSRLEGAVLIPLHELEARTDELEPFRQQPVACLCHHGVRSLAAAAFLRSLGFDATSIAGGIEAWSVDIDPRVPRY
jgi:rhodanese-related sulfurtransferase